jgi:hypothetical protein
MMIRQLGPAASDTGVLRAPGVTAGDLLPLVSGADIAEVADAVLHNFDAYANQVGFFS